MDVDAPASARKGALGWWLVAQIIGIGGTRLINVAVPWFVLVTTRDPRLAGVVAFAQMAPLVISKAMAGPLIDRVGPARVAVTCDLASCVAVAAIPALHAVGWLSWPVLLLIAAVEGGLRGPGDSAKYAMCPALATATGQPLERVTGLANTVDRIGSASGAAFGGLVIAVAGAPSALLLSCGTFLGAAAIVGLRVGPVLAAGRAAAAAGPAVEGQAIGSREPGDDSGPERLHEAIRPDDPAGGAAAAEPSYWARLGEGWRFLRRDPVLVAITTMIALTNLFDQAYTAVLIPEWVIQQGLGADSVGLFFGTMTGAAIVGSAIATAIGDKLPKLPTYVVCFALGGAPRFLAFAAELPKPAIIAVLVLCGVTSGFINPLLGAIVFSRIPSDMVGRVSSLITALCWLLMPFGGLAGALLILGFGMAPALYVVGLAYLAVTMAPAVLPAFRAMGKAPA